MHMCAGRHFFCHLFTIYLLFFATTPTPLFYSFSAISQPSSTTVAGMSRLWARGAPGGAQGCQKTLKDIQTNKLPFGEPFGVLLGVWGGVYVLTVF